MLTSEEKTFFILAMFTIGGASSLCNNGCEQEEQRIVPENNDLTLFNFTTLDNVDSWVEQSDTRRTVGKSKATIVLQKTQVFQRAVLFFLLNPQPNGAGFAGVRTFTALDLRNYRGIAMHLRGQGSFPGFKVVLRHKGLNEEPHPSYEQFFSAQLNNFELLFLPLSGFKPYYRGRPLNSTEAEPLDTSNITSFGIQFYGGVYMPSKQSGVASLEIDWIKAL